MIRSEPEGVPREVFSRLYRQSPDPWDFAHSPYERGRYQSTLDALLRPRYRRAFEPGCSVGELTLDLSRRCNEVVAVDLMPEAVETARHRCADQHNVSIHVGDLARQVSPGPFDLIVMSEIGYYFCESKLAQIAKDLASRLEPGGELLAVHWLGDSRDHLLHGDAVHDILRITLPLDWVKGARHVGFRLDTWTRP